MKIIIDFLKDGAKIVFGSVIVGFFIPGLSGNISLATFLGGILATMFCLIAAIVLTNKIKPPVKKIS